jgi:DNA sulfur modification protein DndC
MVKEDKSLTNFIDHGAKELEPLREYRNWLVEMRSNPDARDYRRRNGSVYTLASGELGRGPFTLETRKLMLRKLLELEEQTGYNLISMEELKYIDKVWESEGDLSCRALVDIYYEVKGKRLPWDQYKKAKYDDETLSYISELCDQNDVPFDLISRLMVAVDNNKLYTRSRNTDKEIEKILNQGWLHYETIREELKNEIDEN